MEYAKILLTDEQRHELTKFPEDVKDWKIAKYYTLNDFDITVILEQRKDYNRIGFALQLCCLRYPGWTLTNINDIPEIIVHYVASQINADTRDLQAYGLLEKTRLEHLQKLLKI
jgi:TnpA family transposase